MFGQGINFFLLCPRSKVLFNDIFQGTCWFSKLSFLFWDSDIVCGWFTMKRKGIIIRKKGGAQLWAEVESHEKSVETSEEALCISKATGGYNKWMIMVKI